MAPVTTSEGEVEKEDAEVSDHGFTDDEFLDLLEEEFTSSSPSSGHADENRNEGRINEDNSNARKRDKFLPFANITRIMKKALPANAKIAKDAKEMMQACVSDFISYVTHEANAKCKSETRKIITGDDLLFALRSLGFEDSAGILRTYLDKYREFEGRGGDSTMDNPGDANSEKERAGPPMAPTVQMGPASVSGGGIPPVLSQMPQMPQILQMIHPNDSHFNRPHPMMASNGYQMNTPPSMMPLNGYQINMPPPMMRLGNYQIDRRPPMTEPGSNQMGMPPAPNNYEMQNPMMGLGNYQIGMRPPMAEPGSNQMETPPALDNYEMQNRMMGAPGNQQL